MTKDIESKPNVQCGFKSCKHVWQYEGPIQGRKASESAVVRCCRNCGRREMAFTRAFVLAKGDYALNEHYQGMDGAA